jgi:hypothetical protein
MAAPESITADTDRHPSALSLHTSAGDMPVSLAALQQAGVQFDAAEAIAIAQALCLACTGVQSRDKNDGTVGVVVRVRPLDNETVLIDPTSRLGVRAVDPGDEATAIRYIGRVLSEIAPHETRRKIETKIIAKALASPPQFGSLTELSDALTKFENGQRRELIQQVYDHWKISSAEAGAGASASVDSGSTSGIRFGSPMTAVRAAIIAVSVLLGGVSATILIARSSTVEGAVTEEGAVTDTSSNASTLLESRPIAPLSSGLVGWSVARAKRPALSTTVLPVQRNQVRASIAAAPAAAKTAPAAPTPIARSRALDEPSAVSNPPMPRPANEFPAMAAPVGASSATAEPLKSATTEPPKNVARAAPVELNAQPMIYSGHDKDVVPPTPILAGRRAGLAPSSPGIRLDTLVIAVVVDEDGRARSVNAINRPQNVGEAMLLTSALAAIKQWEFDPALKDGVPVRYRLIVPLGKLTGSAP